MPYEDFREFIKALQEQGELIEVDRPVSLNLEVGKALRKSAASAGPAILFKNNGTPYPLIGGVYNSRKKALIAFQTTEDAIFEKILHGLNHPLAPEMVQNAPCHEHRFTHKFFNYNNDLLKMLKSSLCHSVFKFCRGLRPLMLFTHKFFDQNLCVKVWP